MRAQRANGRPGTAVIPASWGASHATVSSRTRNATVSLSAPTGAGAGWDPDTETTTITPGAPYATAVSARIQALVTRSDTDTDAAEETVTKPPYLVTVDYGQDVTDGTVITVTACPGDPALVERTLRVDHVVHGTERFERDLLCTLIDLPAPAEDA